MAPGPSSSEDRASRTLRTLSIAAILATVGPTLAVEVARWIGLVPEATHAGSVLVLQALFLAATWPATIMLALVRDRRGRPREVFGVASSAAMVATAIDVVVWQTVRTILERLGLDLQLWMLRNFTIAWACGAMIALWAIRTALPLRPSLR